MQRLMSTAVFAAFVIAAPAVLAQEPVSDITATLTIFERVSPDFVESTNRAIERFKLKYPNVTIEAQYAPVPTWGEYISSFLNQVASGQSPDILDSAIEGFAEVSSKGLMADLTGIIANDPAATAVLADIDPNLLEGMKTRPGGELNF